MEKFVEFKSNKKRIVGILHIPEGKPKFPGVLLCHGFTGTKSESHFIFTKLARNLVKNGIVVLRFDFIGSGDSEGNFEEMTLETEIADGEKAIEYLMKRKEVIKEKTGILGVSMGSVIATYLASKYKNVKSLCLWSPLAYSSIIRKKILTRKIKEKLEKNGKAYIPGGGHYISKEFIQSTYKVKPLEFASSFYGKVMIIHSKDDQTLPLQHALAYFKKFHLNSSSCKLLIFEKGNHTFITEFSEKTAIKETTNFFLHSLRG